MFFHHAFLLKIEIWEAILMRLIVAHWIVGAFSYLYITEFFALDVCLAIHHFYLL